MGLLPIRRNPKTGLLPKGLKRRPSNKTWRKGHRLKSGKWVPGIWVFRAGKAKPSIRKKPARFRRPKAKKPTQPTGVPKRIAKPRVRAAAKVSRPLPAPVVKRVVERPKPRKAPAPRITPGRSEKAWNRLSRTERIWATGPVLGITMTRKEAENLASRTWKALPPGPRRRLTSGVALWEGAGRMPVTKAVVRPSPKPSLRPKVQAARKPWSSERRRRARLVASRTGSSVVAADALIRRAKSKGVDYDTVDWDVLQGKDLTFAGRVRRLDKMVGRTSTGRQEAMDLAAKRADFREKQEMKRRERRRKAVDRPGVEHHAMAKIEDDLRRRAEQLERALFGL